MPEKALITGASSGIGAALARRMAARGVEVYLAARRADRLLDEVKAIEARGGKAHAISLDVSDPDATAARVLALDEESGGLDVVVANAGIGDDARMARGEWRVVERVFRTNLLGATATLLPVVPRMIERGRGHLVAISSLSALLPLPLGIPYAASKAALSHLVEGMRMELAPRGVAVTLVEPGFIVTEMTAKNRFPMPFLLDVDVAARIIDRGIRAKAKRVRFPRRMVALIRLGLAIPGFVREPFVRRAALPPPRRRVSAPEDTGSAPTA